MFKYKYNGDLHTDEKGNSYKPSRGILTVPFEIKSFSHLLIEEEKKELTEKELLIEEAESLGMAVSKLKRNSVEKIKEAIKNYKEAK